MNYIKLENLKTLNYLPSCFSSPMEKQEYFSIVLHNVSMLIVKNNPELLKKTQETLNDWKKNKEISIDLYLKWSGVIHEFERNPEILIEKSEKMQQLRSISPFSYLETNKILRKEIFDIVFNIPEKKKPIKDKKTFNYLKYA